MTTIGGNPSVEGSLNLSDEVVSEAFWKSSANATGQAIDTIILDGQVIWERPNYDVTASLSVTSATNASGHVLLSVTVPEQIDYWKYQIGSGSISASQTGTSIELPFSQFNNLTSTTVTVTGYRSDVQRAETTDTILLVKHGIEVNNVISLGDTLDLEMTIVPVNITAESRWEYKIDDGSWQRGGPISGGLHEGFYRLASPVSENQSPIQLPGGSHTVYVRYVGVRDGVEYVHFTTSGNTFTSIVATEIVTEASDFVFTENQLSVIADGIIQGDARAGEISYSDEWLDESDAFNLGDVSAQFSSSQRNLLDWENVTIYRFDLRKLGVTYYPGIPMQVQMGYGFNHRSAKNDIHQIPWQSRIVTGLHNKESYQVNATVNTIDHGFYEYRDYKYDVGGGIQSLSQVISGVECDDSTTDPFDRIADGLDYGWNTGHALTHQQVSRRRDWIDQIFPNGIPGEAQGIDYFQLAESACLQDSYQPRGLLERSRMLIYGSILTYDTYTQPGFDGWDGNFFCNVIKPVQGNADDADYFTYFHNKMGTPNSGLWHANHYFLSTNFGEKTHSGDLVQPGVLKAWTNESSYLPPVDFADHLANLSGILYKYFNEPIEHQWGIVQQYPGRSNFRLKDLQTYGEDHDQMPEFAGNYFYIAQYTGENTTVYHTPRIRVNKDNMWGEGEAFDNDVIYYAREYLSSEDQTKFANIPNSYRIDRSVGGLGEKFPAPIFPTYKIYFDKHNEYASWSHTLFCPLFYLNNNSDLLAAYGKRNIAAATEHFLTYGINEESRNDTYGPFEYNRENNPYGTVTLPGPTASNDDFSTTLLEVMTKDGTTNRAPDLYNVMKAPGRYQTGARGKEYHVIKGYDATGAVAYKQIINI